MADRGERRHVPAGDLVGLDEPPGAGPVDEEVELPDFIAAERAAKSKEKRILDRLPEQLAKMEDFSKVTAIAPEVDPNRAIDTTSYIKSLPVSEGE